MKIISHIILYPLSVLLLISSCTSDKKTTEVNHHEAQKTHGPEENEHADEHEKENPDQVELTQEQEELAEIKTGSIQKRVLGQVLRVNGVIDVPPDHMVSVSTPYGGTLKSTELLEGSKVVKGQVLAVLQNPQFVQIQQEYLQAKSQLEYLKAEYERKQLLYQEEVTSQKSFQAAKAEYQSQAVQVNALAEQLKLIGFSPAKVSVGNMSSNVPIRSSINGFVTAVNVNVGKFVQPMEVLFELVDPRHQHVELTVYQQNVDQVKPGQRVLYSLAGENKMERKATVYLVGKAIGEQKSVEIHAHPEDETDPTLRPGAYVQALIETGSKPVLSVPDLAVVEFEEKNYVFLLQHKATNRNGSTYRMVEVRKGLSEGGYTEVRAIAGAGLDSTAQVVVEGAYSLLGKLKNKEEEGGHAH